MNNTKFSETEAEGVKLKETEKSDKPQIQQILKIKKAFVEPRLSLPVDVLESTTFFQIADSGGA